MADYTKDDIFDIITEYLQKYGSAIGESSVRELTAEELADDENLLALTIPGVIPQTEEWVQTNMRNMVHPINVAVAEWETLEPQIESAITAADGADNLNAQLAGMTVTITNRQGVSSSVNIGFEIYRTYTSVAAMNADAANVPEGKFVMIGTTDPTSSENARLYARAGASAQESFMFLSDLDQASSAAWADWLNNMKPLIVTALATADADHAQAVSDSNRATADHNTASNDHTQAGTDHSASVTATGNANTQANRAKALADHPPYIGDGTTGDENYWYLWDETTNTYIKGPYAKGDNLDISTMTPEEYQQLIDDIRDSVLYATIAESEAAAEELT